MAITLTYADACKLMNQFGWDKVLELADKVDEKYIKQSLDEKRVTKPTLDDEKTKLISQLGISEKEADRIIRKYGAYGGARNYRLRQLGLDIPSPIFKCDDSRKEILKRYIEIRDTQGIKEANEYFKFEDEKLRKMEEIRMT